MINKSNIIFIGLFEDEKITMEKEVANYLNKEFYNVIEEIEKYINMNINIILKTFKERKINNALNVIINKLLKKENVVICINKNTVLKKENIERIKKNCIIISSIENNIEYTDIEIKDNITAKEIIERINSI